MIIIGSAKKMNDIESDHLCKLNTKTKALVEVAASKTKEEFMNDMKIKNDTLTKTMQYYKNFHDSNAYYALYKYNGVVYQKIQKEYTELNEKQREYIEDNIYIISALYGIINGLEPIKNYRLDFKNSKFVGGNLNEYWKKEINEYILRKQPIHVLNLSSTEFSSLLDRKKFTKENIKVIDLNINAKVSSYKLKEIRGEILNYCLENQIKKYDQLDKVELNSCKITGFSENKLYIECT